MNEAREEALAAEEARLHRQQRRAQREPLNWPSAALGIVALCVLAFVAWICGGVATNIWGG
jgi:hypothetical protein